MDAIPVGDTGRAAILACQGWWLSPSRLCFEHIMHDTSSSRSWGHHMLEIGSDICIRRFFSTASHPLRHHAIVAVKSWPGCKNLALKSWTPAPLARNTSRGIRGASTHALTSDRRLLGQARRPAHCARSRSDFLWPPPLVFKRLLLSPGSCIGRAKQT